MKNPMDDSQELYANLLACFAAAAVVDRPYVQFEITDVDTTPGHSRHRLEIEGEIYLLDHEAAALRKLIAYQKEALA